MSEYKAQNSGIGVPLGGASGNIPAIDSANNPVDVVPAARGQRTGNEKDTPDKNGFDALLKNSKSPGLILIVLAGAYMLGLFNSWGK